MMRLAVRMAPTTHPAGGPALKAITVPKSRLIPQSALSVNTMHSRRKKSSETVWIVMRATSVRPLVL